MNNFLVSPVTDPPGREPDSSRSGTRTKAFMFLGLRTQHINFWPLATGRETPPHPVGRPPPPPGRETPPPGQSPEKLVYVYVPFPFLSFTEKFHVSCMQLEEPCFQINSCLGTRDLCVCLNPAPRLDRVLGGKCCCVPGGMSDFQQNNEGRSNSQKPGNHSNLKKGSQALGVKRPFSEQLSEFRGHSRSNSRNFTHNLGYVKAQFLEQLSERLSKLLAHHLFTPNSRSHFFKIGGLPARQNIIVFRGEGPGVPKMSCSTYRATERGKGRVEFWGDFRPFFGRFRPLSVGQKLARHWLLSMGSKLAIFGHKKFSWLPFSCP